MKIREGMIIAAKGFCMGIADIIPGVSGGTVAFLMGIYEELIESLYSFDQRFLSHLLKGHLRTAFATTGWKFLCALLIGILTAIFSLSHMMKWLLEEYPVYLSAFFFGIIATTVLIIAQKVKKMSVMNIIAGCVSAVAMFYFVAMLPLETPYTWWFLFLSGAIAICAMILPGISGAFILLILGKYHYIITAVSERNFFILSIFSLGCLTGLLLFVRLLRWLLKNHSDITLIVLAGLVLGSLRRIWPWKETVHRVIFDHGTSGLVEQQINIVPNVLTFEFFLAIIFVVLGVSLSLWMVKLDRQRGAL